VYNLDDDAPVASTEFRYNSEKVEIVLYSPKKAWLDSDEYVCRFSIAGGKIKHTGRCIGLDSMQSVILALRTIGDYLENADELDRSLISWDGGPLIFPTFKDA
jgi:hypothetical protein